jgi:flagellar motility protein MotE (MotC chaperone)
MSQRRKRLGQGVLVILALLLASSGALRLGHGIGAALALVPEEPPDAADAAVCDAPPAALARALSEREQKASALEASVEDRMAALQLAEQAITERLASLDAAEARLAATLALADGAAEQDLARLTVVYETMKPADAAALFEAMAPEFAAGFLARMRPEAAAAVMAGLTPNAAYAISVLFAARNAGAPTE